MRIAGFAGEGLRSERLIHETFPSKELQDYWSTRPHYEEQPTANPASTSSSGSGSNQGYQEWLATQGRAEGDEPPPPPYSLEAEAAATPTPVPTQQPAAPPAPASTRPQAPLVPPRRPSDDVVSNLANAMNAVAVSSSPQIPGSSPPPSSVSASPPPVNRPRPTSPPVATHSRPAPSQSNSGEWEQAQWPPPGWQTPQQQHPAGPPRPPPRPASSSASASGGAGSSAVPPVNNAARPSLSHSPSHSRGGAPPPPPIRSRPTGPSGAPNVVQPPQGGYSQPEPHPYSHRVSGYGPQYSNQGAQGYGPIYGSPGSGYASAFAPPDGPHGDQFFGFPQASPCRCFHPERFAPTHPRFRRRSVSSSSIHEFTSHASAG
jgi:hypothetical protein